MSRNALYVVIAVLVVVAGGLGVYIYNQQQQEPSLQIRVDENGLKVDGNG